MGRAFSPPGTQASGNCLMRTALGWTQAGVRAVLVCIVLEPQLESLWAPALPWNGDGGQRVSDSKSPALVLELQESSEIPTLNFNGLNPLCALHQKRWASWDLKARGQGFSTTL